MGKPKLYMSLHIDILKYRLNNPSGIKQGMVDNWSVKCSCCCANNEKKDTNLVVIPLLRCRFQGPIPQFHFQIFVMTP